MVGRDFEVSIISTPSAGKKMDGDYMEDWLNRNFRLADYGRGVEEVFVLCNTEKIDKPPHYRFHPDDQFLELIIPLRESDLRNAGREATILMMAVAIANTLKTIPLPAIPHFDLAAFREELEEMIE